MTEPQVQSARDATGAAAPEHDDLESLEIDLLLEAIYRRYGFDFRQYALASLRRRLWRRIHAERLDSISGLQAPVPHDSPSIPPPLLLLALRRTATIRPPAFYRAFREQAPPP